MFELDHLKNGENKVTAQFAKRDNEDGDGPDWGPQIACTLSVQRRPTAIHYGRKVYPAGEIISVYVVDFPWAEYCQDQFENGEFLAGEYRMRILGVL